MFVLKVCTRSFVFLMLMTVLTVGYTFFVTAAGEMVFPRQSGGSLFEAGGRSYSALLGQPFSAPNHLWGRPVTVDTTTYQREGKPLLYAGASNLSPATEAFSVKIQQRIAMLRAAHPGQGAVPVELVTESGSGLDPHISPAAAEYQVDRLVRSTGFTADEIRQTIALYTEGRFLGVFGEPRVHVLKVNLALDGLLPKGNAVAEN